MSCGHAVTPESLTGWCRSLLDQVSPSRQPQRFLFQQEVRRLAVLTTEEMQYFEEHIARLAVTEYCEYKACPGCKTYVEREDLTNLNVQCTVCTADKKKLYHFCWQCLKEWKGPAPRSDRCDNDNCINHDLELLKTCKDTTLPQVQGVDKCPSIRACPTCGQRAEHDKTGCKNIICPRCQIEFCFVCLKLTSECLKTSSYFIACSAGVAPRQTSIPVWHRKFVDRDDELDFLCEGFQSLRALMSCGHGVTPTSLSNWCRRLLDTGKSRFVCGRSGCGAEWSYAEVCKMALLTPEEMKYFKKAMASNTKRCSDCDENSGCTSESIKTLRNCPNINLKTMRGAPACPSIRACPTCGILLQYDNTSCKNITCPRCNVKFCFVCLKVTAECMKTSKDYMNCTGAVAPRQMTIPVWHRTNMNKRKTNE